MGIKKFSGCARRVFDCKQSWVVALICTTMISGIDASLAQAQVKATDGVGSIEEIIVTARRRSENVQDVPVSITVFSQQDIAAGHITSLDDIINNTPNATFTNNGSRDRREVSIRGVSNHLDPARNVRPTDIATYYDDFNVSVAITNPQIVDVKSVEVLRGPQGTFYGRNAIGGALNVTTNMPTNTFEGHIGLGYAEFNTLHQEGVVNIPLSETLAIRLAGSSDTSDGYIKNIHPIGGGNDSTNTTGRLTIRYKPIHKLTLDFTASYIKEVVGMLDGVPTGFLTSFPRALYYGGSATAPADPDGVGFFPKNRDRVNFNFPQRIGTNIWYTTGRGTYDISDAMALTAIVGYIKSESFNYGDVDGSSLDYFHESYPQTRDSMSAEVRLQSTGLNVIDWVVGALIGRDTGDSDQSTSSGPAFTVFPVGTVIGGQVSSAETKYHAFYAEATWNFLTDFSATVGGRYSYDHVSEKYDNISVGQITFSTDDSVSDSNFSPHFTLSYNPMDSLMFYATASRGFKAGGVQTNPLVPNPTYRSETLQNYEMGVKSQFFNDRLLINLSFYDLKWKNLQSQVLFQYLRPDGSIQTVRGVDNAASARSRGAEFQLNTLLTDQFQVSASVGYMDGKFLEFPNAYIDGVVTDASGKSLVNAPKWTMSANAKYTFNPIAQFTPFIRTEWFYRDKTLSNLYGLRYDNWPFIVPAYNNTNLRVGVSTDRYSITAYVENIFDNNYFTNAYEKAFRSGVQVVPSYRAIGVNMTYNF